MLMLVVLHSTLGLEYIFGMQNTISLHYYYVFACDVGGTADCLNGGVMTRDVLFKDLPPRSLLGSIFTHENGHIRSSNGIQLSLYSLR